jgi:hypothetical protein
MNKYKVKSALHSRVICVDAQSYTIALDGSTARVTFYTGTAEEQVIVAQFFHVDFFLVEQPEIFG